MSQLKKRVGRKGVYSVRREEMGECSVGEEVRLREDQRERLRFENLEVIDIPNVLTKTRR